MATRTSSLARVAQTEAKVRTNSIVNSEEEVIEKFNPPTFRTL